MNDRGASPEERQFEDELRAEYDRYVEELRAVLDLDAGLDDIFSRAENEEYIEQLRDEVLDVEGGLAAALAAAEDPDAGQDEDETKRSGRSTSITLSAPVVEGGDSENKLARSRISEPSEDDSGTVFYRISRLRASLIYSKNARARSFFTQKSLQKAVDHLDSLHVGLQDRRLSQSEAHDMLTNAQTALNLIARVVSTREAAIYYLFMLICIIPLLVVAAAFGLDWRVWVVTAILVVSVGMQIRGTILTLRDRRVKIASLHSAFERLHGDVDRLFDSSDDYNNVVTKP